MHPLRPLRSKFSVLLGENDTLSGLLSGVPKGFFRGMSLKNTDFGIENLHIYSELECEI